MVYTITSYHLFAAACLAYILAGLFCGYTRWRHLCRPFNEERDKYYPCHKQVTFFFTAQVLQFPYLLNPADGQAWLYVRIFAVLYYPLCFTLMIRRYFRRQSPFYRHLDSVSFFAVMGILLTLMALVLIPGCDGLVRHEKAFMWGAAVLSIGLIMRLTQVSLWLKRRIESYHLNNYSNEEDFPLKFAQDTLLGVFVWVIIMGILFVTGNRWVKFACDVLLTLWQVSFLISILHPQLPYQMTEEGGEEASPEEGIVHVFRCEEKPDGTLPSASVQVEKVPDPAAARALVLEVMCKKYKNPHLQKAEVLEAIPKGMKREANAFILQIGYYNLVNMFRLRHAKLYVAAKPSATQDDIAEASGFTSRFAFYRARKSVKDIDPDLVSEVKL